MTRGRRRLVVRLVALLIVIAADGLGADRAAQPAAAGGDVDGWHPLVVPGGQATLDRLGAPAWRDRATAIVDLVRRLHFAFAPPDALESAVRALAEAPVNAAAASPGDPDPVVPSPLSAATWATAIFRRAVPPRRLLGEILADPPARLLWHGLAGLDAGTRRWFDQQPALLRRLYERETAVRAFALFAAALRVVDGQVVIPGGATAVARWTRVLEAPIDDPARFIATLFDDRGGRTAGLYFLAAFVEPARQRFLLNAGSAGEAGERRFADLVAGFARCYPSNSTAAYPFALRSHDAALLLLEVRLRDDGALPGPVARRFWERVFEGPPQPGDVDGQVGAIDGGGDIDAAWMIERLCGVPSATRESVFTTLLAGQRTFAGLPAVEWPAALAALRMRQAYPALFIALEHAGVRRAGTYASLAAQAAQVARVGDAEHALVALRQFQGAVALTLGATRAATFDGEQAASLLESLAALPFERGRYDGGVATWLERQWLPAVAASAATPGATAEEAAAGALAGPPDRSARLVHWEGLDYVVDQAGTVRRRLRAVRKRQGGLSLDDVLELSRLAASVRERSATARDRSTLHAALGAWAPRLAAYRAADEDRVSTRELSDAVTAVQRALAGRGGGRARDAAVLRQLVDVLLAQVLASWAFAPHLGDADGGVLTGGDGALRHRLGVRERGSVRLDQPWAVPIASGATTGALLALQVPLGPSALGRLSNDVMPMAPTIGATDRTSFLITAVLSDGRRLGDDTMSRLAAAVRAGEAAIAAARRDPARLVTLGDKAALSPWTREVLPWVARDQPDRLDGLFSLTERARLGGLEAASLDAWGAASMATGCLCLRMPPPRIPEVILGRAADGIVGGQSVDLMLRLATHLSGLALPASLAAPVLGYAMRDHLAAVAPRHTGDVDAFARQARALDRATVEDYVGAIAAVGPLRPVAPR